MKVNYSGVDWLTATSTSHDVGSIWYQIFTGHVKNYGSMALVNQRWHNGWYAGLEYDGVKFGYSESLGYILIASSDNANEIWPRVTVGPHRITRLDLCCDVVLPNPKSIAQQAFKRIMDARKENSQRKYSLYKGTDGGSTLNVGSRQSSQYGRLYDKGVESGLAERGLYWRFEVEYKKPVSMAIAERLREHTEQTRSDEIQLQVSNWFTARQVTEATPLVTGEVEPIIVMQRETTTDRKLAWLRTQVSPTVRMLMEAGLGRQVALALFQDNGDIMRMMEDAKDLL